MDSNLKTSDSLQPTSDGLKPNSDGLQPTSDGLQPTSDGRLPTRDGLQLVEKLRMVHSTRVFEKARGEVHLDNIQEVLASDVRASEWSQE